MRRSPALAVIAVVVAVLAFVNFVARDATGIPVAVSHPLFMLAMVDLLFAYVFPAFTGHGRQDPVPASAGPPLAEGSFSGRIGVLAFRGPLLKVSVFGDRVVLRPLLMGERTILAAHIAAVRPDTWGLSGGLSIEHTTSGTRSPVFVRVTSGPVFQALTSLRIAGAEAPARQPEPRWNLTTIMLGGGIVASSVFTAMGVYFVTQGFGLFSLAFLALGAIGLIQLVLQFRKAWAGKL